MRPAMAETTQNESDLMFRDARRAFQATSTHTLDFSV